MPKGKGNSSRNLTQDTEATARESSHRPRSRVGRLLEGVKGGVNKLRPSRSKDSRNRSPVPRNVYHEHASSTSVQATPSAVEVEPNTQSALQDTEEAVTHMHPLSKHATTGVSLVQDAQEDLDAADSFQDIYLKPLKIFDAVIGDIADVHPYAKMALGVLSYAAKIILAQVDLDRAVRELLKKLGEVYNFITQDEMLGKISSMHDVLERISQQTRECAYFIKDYSETKKFWKRLGKNIFSETEDTIKKYNDVFDKLMQNFRDQITCDVAIHVHHTEETLDLSGMTCAKGAGIDTGKQCLQGTRTEILSQIKEWVTSTGDNVQRVLWLSGPAGKGKSAIAHTIAKWSEDMGGLGSCYSFDRQREADRRHEKIFSTIARDLADHDLEMRRELADAVRTASSLKNTTDIIQQWQKLLIEPLGKLPRSSAKPIVIVIDALDESGGVETRKDLLHILASKHLNPALPKITDLPNNFRFIVTSRPLDDINNEFRDVQHIRPMSMDDIPPADAKRDIHAYVSQELEGWHFQDEQFAVLAEKADGLFEWARLACGYIKESDIGLSPSECYNAVVSRDPAERSMLLHSMYDLILTDIMCKDASTQHPPRLRSIKLARFRSVMGQILGTAEPLPLASLNAMRCYFPTRDDNFDVKVVVKSMGSLLSGTTNPGSPILPLHASFRDFLTDKSSSGDFFIDLSKAQRDLAFASLRMMQHGLRFNICDLKSSYLPNNEDPGLQERVQKYISQHLSYSCRFWMLHVRTAVFDEELAREVELLFNHERLFFWIELLALINALSGAITALSLIHQWLKGHPEFKGVSSTAMDVQRFIQIFGGLILHSTPHLYVSALPFSPANSPLSGRLSARFPNILRVTSGRDMNWPAVQTVLVGHTASVTSVSFSPDGTRIVTGSEDKTVRLWDAATGQSVGEPLRGHTGSVNSVSFSPDGTRIVTGSEDKTVRLWDASTGKPVGEPLRGHTESITSVSFSPDGTRIVTGSRDTTIWLWDTATMQSVGEPLQGHMYSVNSVSFSPDGTRIVTGSMDNTIQLWDTATGQPVGEPLWGHTGSVYSASFSPDGTRIVTSSGDETVQLWDAATRQPVGKPLRGHTSSSNSVSFSPDGTRIVTGSRDKTVRLWDAATGEPVGKPLQGHTDWVNSVSFSPDGARIVTGSRDKTVRLWDAATEQPVGEPLQGHTRWINSVSFSPDGTRIVAGLRDETVRLWDVVTGRPVGEPLLGHTLSANLISFSPDGARMVTVLWKKVQLWDTATGQPVGKPLQGHGDGFNSASFSPDGTRIVTGSEDKTIWLWDAATGQPVGKPLRGHTESVTSASFSPDGTRIVSGSADTTIWLWDAATGQPVGEPLRGHTESVTSVSFSPDGTRIVSGSTDKTVRLWVTATGQPVGEPLQGHTFSVNSALFSPDSARIILGLKDNTVQLWDTATGQPVGEPLRGHTRRINSASFSPDGTRIVTGSRDKTVRLWDTATGRPVGEPLRGHTRWVNSVSFSPDGTRIVSGSRDKTVRLWDVVTRQPSQQCAVLRPSAFSNEHRTTEATTTMRSNTWNNHFISFSSNSTHALCNTSELTEGWCDDDRSSTHFFLNRDSGWMVGPKHRLLFWVPPASRHPFYSPGTALVIPRGCPELDLSRMAHGQHWQKCREEP